MTEDVETRAEDFYAQRYAERCGDVIRLKAALQAFADIRADDGDTFASYPRETILRCEVTAGDIQDAREAILLTSATPPAPERPDD